MSPPPGGVSAWGQGPGKAGTAPDRQEEDFLHRLLVPVVREFLGAAGTLPAGRRPAFPHLQEGGELLEYDHRPAVSVGKIVYSHADEFTKDHLVVSRIGIQKGRPPRLLTLRGLALLCMFSEQPRAKDVRAWATGLMEKVWTNCAVITPQAMPAMMESVAPVIGESGDSGQSDPKV